jgi:hypothetical protein
VNEFGTYVLYAAGIITSVFRAIKIGWFIKWRLKVYLCYSVMF